MCVSRGGDLLHLVFLVEARMGFALAHMHCLGWLLVRFAQRVMPGSSCV